MATAEYEVKRFYVVDGPKSDIAELDEYTKKNLIPLGFRLFSVVPMLPTKAGNVSFMEVWVRGA